MLHQEVCLLDPPHMLRFCKHGMLRDPPKFALTPTGQADRDQAILISPVNRFDYVGGISTSAKSNQEVLWFSKVLELLHKDASIVVVVGECSDPRQVVSQSKGTKSNLSIQ